MNIKTLIIILIALAVVVVVGMYSAKSWNKKSNEKSSATPQQSQTTTNSQSAVRTEPQNRVVNAPVVYTDDGFQTSSLTISKGQPVVIENKSKGTVAFVVSGTQTETVVVETGKNGVITDLASGDYQLKDGKNNTLKITVKD